MGGRTLVKRKFSERISDLFAEVDAFIRSLMSRYGIPLLRVALAINFIWFGALKVAGVSPVSDLVGRTVYWFSPDWFVPFLGVWEIAIGIGLLLRLALRVTLFLMFAQLAGTFLVPVIQPEVAFVGGNPLILTTEGEFVVKNLVLLAAGIVIGATVDSPAARIET